MEVAIRSIGVGLAALITVAAAGLLVRRRRGGIRLPAFRKRQLDADRLYAAGM